MSKCQLHTLAPNPHTMAWMLIREDWPHLLQFIHRATKVGESCGTTEITLDLEAVILVSSFTSDTVSLCDQS